MSVDLVINKRFLREFSRIYQREIEGTAFCPYRVCPLGAHSDFQKGKVTGFAIDKGINIAYSKNADGHVNIASLQFEKKVAFHLDSIPPKKQNDWADYLRGAVIILSEDHKLNNGIDCIIDGELPIGGISSSASVIIAFLLAICEANSIKLTQKEIIDIALKSENNYVGISCGILDQSCEIYSKEDCLLYLDTLDRSYELIPASGNMKPYEIAIFYSGVDKPKDGSQFNIRVDECRSAAYVLKAYAGIEYGQFKDTFLRDVPRSCFDTFKNKMPKNFMLRAKHWYEEFERVETGTEAWRRGDMETFGKLIFDSGQSSIQNWNTGSTELILLYEIMKNTDGIYGGRISGAGFKGCCMAIIDPTYRDYIEESVTKQYTEYYPKLKDKFSISFCKSSDGVKL